MAIDTIQQNYVDTYRAMVHDLLEQEGSKLMGIFPTEQGIRGENHFFERLGSVGASERTQRFEEKTIVDGDHSRRMATVRSFDSDRLALDNIDKIKLLVDPVQGYAKKVGFALGRKFDIELLKAMVGTAKGGADGSTSIALSAGQIDTAASALTTDRLIAARAQFVKNNVMDEIYCAIDHEGLEDLLADAKFQNMDYNNVAALMEGKPSRWLGFTFILFGQGIIPEATSGSITRAILFTRDAMRVVIAGGVRVRVDELVEKGHAMQVIGYFDFGMVRMEEELVYDIRVTYS